VKRAVTALRRRGAEVTLRVTEQPGDARSLADELLAKSDAIAVLGGDGTVNEVIQSMSGTGVPLGIIPGGTVNVLAIELGLPFAVEEACDIIAAGRRTTMDLGSLNGRRFALHAGAGLDAMTVREVRGDAKRRFRELAFVAAGLSAIHDHPQPPFRVIVDGREHYATFAVVANCRTYAGRRLRMAPEADPADGVFDVVLFRGWGFADTAAFWLGLTVGTHPFHPGTETTRGRCVRMEPLGDRDVIWLQTDGEPAGRAPSVARLEPGALDVFVR
jgi:diacylglycerol kinase (ATP)